MQSIVIIYWGVAAAILVTEIIINMMLIESLRLRDKEIYSEIGKPGHLQTFKNINFVWFFVAAGKFNQYEFSPISTKLFKIDRRLLLAFLILFVGWFPLILISSLFEQ